MKQPCDAHARRNVRRLKMSGAHGSCNENSWRGCRRVHRGDEAGSEGAGREEGRAGGMSSASHLDCQTLSARLGIFQREADTTWLHHALHCSSPTACLLSFSLSLCLASRMQPFLHAFCRHIRVGGGHGCERAFVCVKQVRGRSQCTAEGRKREC